MMRRMPQARGHKAKYREDAFEDLQAKAKQRIEERRYGFKACNVYRFVSRMPICK